jgi:hypothetical protein
MGLVRERLIHEIPNQRPVVARLRQGYLDHQDRDEPLLWVHPKDRTGCPDPIEFSDRAWKGIMARRDAYPEAKAKSLAILKVRLERAELSSKPNRRS